MTEFSIPTKFMQDLLEDCLGQTNRVTVVKATPGTGKSQSLRQAIQETVQANEQVNSQFRVLWLTQSTHACGSNGLSLGREAQQSFADLNVPVKIVLGLEAAKKAGMGWRSYREQFAWTQQQVKILSHAHLPLVFGSAARHSTDGLSQLKQVDLVVIDEDPTSSLLRSSSQLDQQLTYRRLSKKHTPDALSLALLKVMDEVLDGNLSHTCVPGPPWLGRHFTLTGRKFLRALREALGGADATELDWPSLVKGDELLPYEAGEALKEDLTGRLRDSQRFGLSWNVRQGHDPDAEVRSSITFHYDVLSPLREMPPTIVLDAYADREYYQALFPGQQVKLVEYPPAPHLPPRIHCVYDPTLLLNRREVTAPRSHVERRKVIRVMTRVVAFARAKKRKTVVLVYEDMIEPLTQIVNCLPGARQKAESRKKPGENRSDKIKFQHWYSGRGVNHLAGHHLFALIEPHRPRRFQEHQLAALFPYDGGKRQDMAAHLDRSEILQMLHRNRQVQARLNHNHVPYVIVAFEPPNNEVFLEIPDAPKRPGLQWREKGKSLDGRPKPLDAPSTVDLQWHGQPLKEIIRVVCTELKQHFNAVPTLALMAIGLMVTPTSYRDIVKHVRARLRKEKWSEQTPHLRRWAARPSYFRAYQKTEPQADPAPGKSTRSGRRPARQVDRIDAIMSEHFSNLLKITKNQINLPPGFAERIKYPSRLVVWATSAADANKALAKLLET